MKICADCGSQRWKFLDIVQQDICDDCGCAVFSKEENNPKIIKVIESHIKRGVGLSKGEIKYSGGLSEHKLLDDDLVRDVVQYHTLDGKFLAEVDTRTEKIMNDFKFKEENNK